MHSIFSSTRYNNIIDNVPNYAILSHTWGTDTEEIRFCGEQARLNGLQYFWVDTCCIDKSNNTELAEAINSMFRWYRYAAKCYVYLSDMVHSGWTLQELIAPKSVDFFSKYWELLGSKSSLGTIIHEITGIPDKALRGVSLSDFSVAERMSWADRRVTTRKEDQAYSLLAKGKSMHSNDFER
ncbi:hypothetical protein BKA65DRAFT_526948 [Rhexocercosporidium sp. MPI-PUGE-AT-0058]|nr:hypothetical protein BKA65DRAFT_526948 [Rhexocercosporidium sp. MPI-PUGE-AT-0058]